MYKATERVNIRNGPGQEYEVLTTLDEGLICKGLGDKSEDDSWIKVQFNGVEGWIFSDYLALQDPD